MAISMYSFFLFSFFFLNFVNFCGLRADSHAIWPKTGDDHIEESTEYNEVITEQGSTECNGLCTEYKEKSTEYNSVSTRNNEENTKQS